MVGKPCLAQFGAKDYPGKWEPTGSNHVILRRDVECAGYMLEECKGFNNFFMRKPLRIAIINLTSGGMSGGYKKYLIEMLPRLSVNSMIESIICITPDSIAISDFLNITDNIIHKKCKPYIPTNMLNLGNRNRDIEILLDGFRPDILLLPVDRHIPYKKVPVVNMIRNMEPFNKRIKGDLIRARLKKFVQSFDAKVAVRKSVHTIAVSNYVKDHLVRNMGISHEKVSVVYHGKNRPVPVKEQSPPLNFPADWKGRFLFIAGSVRPARGLEDAFSALEKMGRNGKLKGLVIAGETTRDMHGYRKKLEDRIVERGLGDKVYWAGKLHEQQMGWCYANCSVFVMTSRVESFGQIAVEAMSYGCLCVSADNTCLPEIFRDAAVYYPQEDGKALAGRILEVLNWSDERKKKASEEALQRSDDFSWDATAEQTVEVLLKVVESCST